MKNKIFKIGDTINRGEPEDARKVKFTEHFSLPGSFVAFIFICSLAFMISCAKEDIRSTDPTSASGAQVQKAVAQSTTFSIGQNYGGGIIFYIDATGQHGLIADINDTNYKMLKWGDSYYLNTGATGTAVGTGAANTKKIIAVQGTKYVYAALVCANYRGGGYADWFLPSKDELYLLYKQKMAGVVKGFTWGAYWSSSEFYVASNPPKQAYAWTKIFYSENAFYSLKDRISGVRAIRAF